MYAVRAFGPHPGDGRAAAKRASSRGLQRSWPGGNMRGWTKGALGLLGGVIALGLGQAQAQEIKLGAFMPISGITADVGAQIKAGIEVAVDRANAGGAHVKVMWYDTEGKADVGLNAVNRALTVDKIDAAVGFLSSDIF